MVCAAIFWVVNETFPLYLESWKDDTSLLFHSLGLGLSLVSSANIDYFPFWQATKLSVCISLGYYPLVILTMLFGRSRTQVATVPRAPVGLLVRAHGQCGVCFWAPY